MHELETELDMEIGFDCAESYTETLEETVETDDEYGESVETDDEYGESVAVEDDEAYESEDGSDPILITLIDKKLPGLLEYMREHKLNTQVVTTDPGYISDIMLAQYGKCDILIIDTGSGLFATSEQRKQILNIVQQCEGKLQSFFFYTDDAIRTDIQDSLGRKNKKQITWEKYKTTPITVASMALHCTNYRNDEYEYQEQEDLTPEEILDKHITLPTNLSLSEQGTLTGITPEIVLKNVAETEQGLIVGYTPEFKVKMRI